MTIADITGFTTCLLGVQTKTHLDQSDSDTRRPQAYNVIAGGHLNSDLRYEYIFTETSSRPIIIMMILSILSTRALSLHQAHVLCGPLVVTLMT